MDPEVDRLGLVVLDQMELIELEIGVGQLRVDLEILADRKKISADRILRHVLCAHVLFKLFYLELFIHDAPFHPFRHFLAPTSPPPY